MIQLIILVLRIITGLEVLNRRVFKQADFFAEAFCANSRMSMKRVPLFHSHLKGPKKRTVEVNELYKAEYEPTA